MYASYRVITIFATLCIVGTTLVLPAAAETRGFVVSLFSPASASTDPKTGENRDILTAYFIDAVLAFAIAPDKFKKVAGR